jgi:hypothetical protein
MRTLLASLLLLGCVGLRAELTTDHYRRLQDEAAEALVIKADQVEVKTTLGKDGRQIDVRVTARVQSVLRSKAGHKPGDTVKIAYTVIQTIIPMPGPSQPKVLEKGETVRAYLNPASEPQTLGLAAYGQSFQTP